MNYEFGDLQQKTKADEGKAACGSKHYAGK